MIELYNILTGKYDEDLSNLLRTREMNQQQEAINTICINHTQDWTLENTHAFTQRTVEIWNNLPSKVVTARTIMPFESRLDKFWENQPRKYNYSREIVINTNGHDLNITSLDEELTEEASCEDLQSEEDL
jgi:hypothetical protein